MNKTTYDKRISDWSSDVCSSDLVADAEQPRQSLVQHQQLPQQQPVIRQPGLVIRRHLAPHPRIEPADLRQGRSSRDRRRLPGERPPEPDRKSVLWGTSVSVRVTLGGRQIINKKQHKLTNK